MNVVIDARYLNAPESGIGTYTENLVRELLKVEGENRYGLVTREPGLAYRIDPDRCYDIVFDFPARSRRTIHRLGRMLDGIEYDLFHSTFNLLPLRLNRPSVVTIHDVIPLMDPALTDERISFRWTAGRFWRNGISSAITRASALVTVSETSAHEIAERFGDQVGARITVTGSGIDPFFLETHSEDSDVAERLVGGSFPFVLTVGQGSPRKNHAGALRAFMRAFDSDDSMRFVLVRRLKRRDREFERLAADPSIRNRLTVIGYVDKVQLRALYRNARAFFFPSLVEGFGLPIIEAMASSCPVVTSDFGAMKEVAGAAARLCSPFDLSQMATALRVATTEGPERDRLIRKGIEHANQYSFRDCAERTLEVYRRLAK